MGWGGGGILTLVSCWEVAAEATAAAVAAGVTEGLRCLLGASLGGGSPRQEGFKVDVQRLYE